MKILHLIDSAGLYGAEVVLLHLIAEQKKHGIEIILGSIGKPEIHVKHIETIAKQKKINVKNFRFKNGPNILGSLEIIKFVKQQRIDLIHCHGYKGNILMGILPSHFHKIPYLLTMHGTTSVKRFSKMWIYYWVDTLFAKRANMVVVVSKAMLTNPWIMKFGLKPVVVHNGIPKIVSNKKKKIVHNNLLDNFCSKSFIIGSIGRLSPEKGFDFLVKAVARVINRGYDISLVIIGEGTERKRLENIAHAKGIEDKVLLTGYLDQANQYLSYFDVFVMSSLTEGLPITILEAMQAGVSIVATQVGGIPEVLDNGRCGILVRPGDEHDLAEAITKLHDSLEMNDQLREAARKQIEDEFSSDKMEHCYRKLYEKLLRN